MIEKILETLIEQLHKKMAEGHASKPAKIESELKQATENQNEKEKPTSAVDKSPDISKFTEWLKSENERKPKPKSAKIEVFSTKIAKTKK